ncbi:MULTISPECIES: flavin reductase family protein [unclassified Corynebacterium]|uniref:flavin reductase family protein n=1 Tax=unclassified Corynebacterium TaxID=2624378 RepID=UPI00264EC457|nr:iron-sulfur cluster-binding domain-containing protein [Corynebacterium sp.]
MNKARLGKVVARATKPLTPALRKLTTPLTPTDYAGLFDPLRGREIRGRILGVTRHGGYTTLTISPGPGMGGAFHAGQFIGLGLQIDGRWRWRCYSLTNAPVRSGHGRGRTLTVSVKPVPGGMVSVHLAEHADVGQIIRLSAPGGDFHLPSPLPERLLFVTAGAGITPVMSMLRWLREECTPQTWPDVVHVHSERGARPPSPFADELEALDALDALDADEASYRLIGWDSSRRGRLSAQDVTTAVPDWAARETFACGPGPLLESLTEAMPGTRTETFHAQGAASGSAGTGPDAADLGGTIEFGDSGVTTESTGSTTILDAAENCGVNLVHGCRMGICRTCVAPITDGTAVDLRDGATYGPGEQVRTCCSVPSGYLHIASS